MPQHLSDANAGDLLRSDISAPIQHAAAVPQHFQGLPDPLSNPLYSQNTRDVFGDLPDLSQVSSFVPPPLRTVSSLSTPTSSNSIRPRPAADVDALRSLEISGQLKVGLSQSESLSSALPLSSQIEAAGLPGLLTTSAGGLPPRRANMEYGMLPQQNTSLLPSTAMPLQSPPTSIAAMPPPNLAQSSPIAAQAVGPAPLASIQPPSAASGPQPPLNQQQILQLITSQSPSQTHTTAQIAQILQSPNAQPIINQLAAIMSSTQAAPAPFPVQEEISTIFVVGFPEDMTEREFQNMFTFCPGYEAATLKMPAKDAPSFPNGQPSANAGLRGVFPTNGVSPQQAAALVAASAVSSAIAGASDPYNLVTVNSGGVVVDQGNNQTTTTSSAWSTGLDDVYARSLLATSIAASNASAAGDFNVTGAMGGPTNPSNSSSLQSRKQIIGFAKFRTRAEALEARDVLHGRRVDIEKGSVLKAEMAKKNLHTKRGVGSLQMPATSGTTNVNGLNSLAASGGILSPDILPPLGAAPGLATPSSLTNPMDASLNAGILGYSTTASRLNDTSDAFKVTHPLASPPASFHPFAVPSIPSQLVPNGSMPTHDPSINLPRDLVHSPLRQESSSAWALNHPSPISASNEQPTLHSGPGESYVRHRNGQLGVLSPPPSMGSSVGSLPARPASSVNSASPPNTSYASNETETGAGYSSDAGFSTRSFSPNESMVNSLVGGMQSPDSSTGAMSKVMQIMHGTQKPPINGLNELALTDGSLTSVGKQMQALSGPGGDPLRTSSDGSAGSRRTNAADQNPPINTLYVGNLPTSQAPQSKYLEDALLHLFSRCLGYRKLCFRQKTNGPMCFVEFDDVPSATRALKEQYGNTLNGLVKGGIRLSYSKNPLGVRTAVPNVPPTTSSALGSPLGSPTSQIPPIPLQFGMNTPISVLQDAAISARGALTIPTTDLPTRLRGEDHSTTLASSPPNRLLASPPPSSGGVFAPITSKYRAPVSIASPSNGSIHQPFTLAPTMSPPSAASLLYPGSTFQPFGSAEQSNYAEQPHLP